MTAINYKGKIEDIGFIERILGRIEIPLLDEEFNELMDHSDEELEEILDKLRAVDTEIDTLRRKAGEILSDAT